MKLAVAAYQAGKDLDDQIKRNAYHLITQITGVLAYVPPTEQLLARVAAQDESIRGLQRETERLSSELSQLRRVGSQFQ